MPLIADTILVHHDFLRLQTARVQTTENILAEFLNVKHSVAAPLMLITQPVSQKSTMTLHR